MKNDRMKKTLVSLFFVVILIASTAGFVVTFRQPNDTSYNGYDFEQRNGQWITKVETPFGTEEFAFYNHPLNIDVTINDDILQTIRASPTVVLLFDPNITGIEFVDAARFQLQQYLVTQLGKNVEHAVIINSTLYPFPVQHCSSDKLYLIYTSSENRTITKNDTCITMTSYSSLDFLQYSEAIIYRLLGVIP